MCKKLAMKVTVVILSSIMITFGMFGTAFAWNEVFHTGDKIHAVNPSYLSYLRSGYTMQGNFNADLFSTMNISCNVGSVGAATIKSQAAMSIGTYSGNIFDTPVTVMEFGPRVTNWSGSAQHEFVSSTMYRSISQMYGVGEIGASAWGVGTVSSSNGALNDITTGTYKLLVTAMGTPAYYVPGSVIGARSAEESSYLLSGEGNFVGADGLLYGVAYVNENGEGVMPDMARVALKDGGYGYISINEMHCITDDYSSFNTSRSSVEDVVLDAEARLFQQAFAEYYGIDVLSYEAALICAEETRYLNGEQTALETIREDTQTELFSVINEKSGTEELSAADASVSSITEEDYRIIYEDVLSKLSVSIPVYDSDGITEVGVYSVSRF